MCHLYDENENSILRSYYHEHGNISEHREECPNGLTQEIETYAYQPRNKFRVWL